MIQIISRQNFSGHNNIKNIFESDENQRNIVLIKEKSDKMSIQHPPTRIIIHSNYRMSFFLLIKCQVVKFFSE